MSGKVALFTVDKRNKNKMEFVNKVPRPESNGKYYLPQSLPNTA